MQDFGTLFGNNSNIQKTYTAMKRFLTLLTALLLVGSFAFSADAQNRRKKESKYQEVTFVTSIDCKNCVKKVEAKLPDEKGIKDMKVTLADKTVWIKYDATKTDKEKLAAAINRIGFEATEIEAAPKR